jgi:hypothetical protein
MTDRLDQLPSDCATLADATVIPRTDVARIHSYVERPDLIVRG